MTVDEIISNAGGTSRLAAALGVNHSTVSGWKRDGRIPAERVIAIHEKMGIPLADIPRRQAAPAQSVEEDAAA